MNTGELVAWVRDARERTIELVTDLTDEQLMGPKLAVINPVVWQLGHVAWFQEKWVLRGAAGQHPLGADGDSLYDSAAIPHDTSWDLPLPSREGTLAYMRAVRDRVIERIEQGKPDDKELYFIHLSVFHEDMHTEAFTYTRQTLAYPPPTFSINGERAWQAHGTRAAQRGGPFPGDAEIPGGRFLLGALPGEPFVFDNEKWAHPIDVKPFAIARAAVTQAEFAAFVEDQGYRSEEHTSELQSLRHLVCRLLLEKKKKGTTTITIALLEMSDQAW